MREVQYHGLSLDRIPRGSHGLLLVRQGLAEKIDHLTGVVEFRVGLNLRFNVEQPLINIELNIIVPHEIDAESFAGASPIFIALAAFLLSRKLSASIFPSRANLRARWLPRLLQRWMPCERYPNS